VKSDIWVSIVIYTYFTIITITNQDVQDPICGVAAAVKVNGWNKDLFAPCSGAQN